MCVAGLPAYWTFEMTPAREKSVGGPAQVKIEWDDAWSFSNARGAQTWPDSRMPDSKDGAEVGQFEPTVAIRLHP